MPIINPLIMIKQIVFSCLAATLIPLVATASSSAEDNSIIVSGRVVNIPENGSRTIIIDECDISDKSERRITELDSAGGFHERLPISYGHTFTVNYNRSLFINLYAEPGDSIDLLLDASKSPVEFHVMGDRAEFNEELSHVSRDLRTLLFSLKLLPDTAGVQQYMTRFRHEVDSVYAEAEKYFAEHSVSDRVADMVKRDLLFGTANQAISFEGHGSEDQKAFFTDRIFNITDPDNVKVMIFPYHLQALMLCYPEYIDSVPKGIVRDLMYVTGVDNGRISVMPERSDFSNQGYYDRIFGSGKDESLLASGPLPAGDMIVYRGDSIQALENVDFKEWLVKEYPGQGIYLDVSATWCGPCRASLSRSEGIREHFKDSGVRFVILWLKSDKDAWAQLAPTIHNAVQIFVESDDLCNLLLDRLNVMAFPSYRFIEPDGRLIEQGVPGFISADLADFIKSKL